ncbi:Uncharacterized protein HZ326_18522 [Fusarium oxysporum f. sp. albedinis]|nr:Uncharacterized protein HZ326_18522 [Fusarium oxysporum f. sp. albedinis]
MGSRRKYSMAGYVQCSPESLAAVGQEVPIRIAWNKFIQIHIKFEIMTMLQPLRFPGWIIQWLEMLVWTSASHVCWLV